MGVDGALEGVDVGAAHGVEQLRAREDAPGWRASAATSWNSVGVRSIAAPSRDTCIRALVDDEVSAPQHVAAGAGGIDTAQHRAHARHQLARAEWLGHVVVRAELETGEPIGFVDPRRQHDDRDVAFAAQCSGHLEAVHARQTEVEHDQVRPFARALVPARRHRSRR